MNDSKVSREIGGMFEFPHFDYDRDIYSINNYLLNLNSDNSPLFLRDGRQAIKFILSNISTEKKICFLPAYLCYSILKPFLELKCDICFYHHASPLVPQIDEHIHDSVILLIDYFGTECLPREKIEYMLLHDNTVILDVTHSILNKRRFSLNHKNLYYIASLRKIFPIPDGSIVFHMNPNMKSVTRVPMNDAQILNAMLIKYFYINNLFSYNNLALKKLKESFLKLYHEYELEKEQKLIIYEKIPVMSTYILNKVNIKNTIERRVKNMNILFDELKCTKNLLLDKDSIKSPFFLPLVFETNLEREQIKEVLIKNDIYPPIHWGLPENVPRSYSYEHSLSERTLSIPIDQRYCADDMQRICGVLNGNI